MTETPGTQLGLRGGGVAAIPGSAADYAGIPQNALLAVVTGVVFRFLSRQQRPDQVLQIAGATAFATAAVCGALTVTGLLPGVSAVTVGAVLAATVWLLAIAGHPPDPRNRRLGTSKGSMTMRTAYRALAYLLALSVAVQASLIAFGAFALENNIDNGPVSDGETTGVTLHHSFAYVVLLCAVALLAVSFGAKVTHGVRWAAIPLGLIVVQFFLAYAAYSAAIIGALHGLNALAIFAVALLAGRRVPKTAPVEQPSAPEDAPV